MSVRMCAGPKCQITFSGAGPLCPTCVERKPEPRKTEAAAEKKTRPVKAKRSRRKRHYRAKPAPVVDRRELDRAAYLSKEAVGSHGAAALLRFCIATIQAHGVIDDTELAELMATLSDAAIRKIHKIKVRSPNDLG